MWVTEIKPLTDLNLAAEDTSITGVRFVSMPFTTDILNFLQRRSPLHWTSVSIFTCRGDMGRVFPALKHSIRNLQELRVEGTVIPPAALAILLATSSTLKSLFLNRVNFDASFCEALGYGLEKTSSLETLVWNHQGTTRTLESKHLTHHLLLVLRGIQRNDTLQRIETDLCDEDFAIRLFQVVSHHPMLTELHLQISPPATTTTTTCCTSRIQQALEQLLQCQSSKLSVLKLCINGDMTLWQTTPLPTNNRIQYCLEPTNAKTDQDMVLLGRMLVANSNVIQELDLGHNGISSGDLDILIPSLVQARSLVRLYLPGNTLSPEGAATLLQAANSPMSKIQTMQLPFCCPISAELQHAVDMNRAGQSLLQDPVAPVALWPLVLERAGKLTFGSGDTFDSSAKRANGIYHLLHGPATLYQHRRRDVVS
jgi:hypothetical protein